MLSKNIFMRPRNELEEGDQRPGAQEEQRPSVPDDLCVACPSCKKVLFSSDLAENLHVCPKCGHHFRMSPRQRIHLIADEGSFQELFPAVTGVDPLSFPGYEKKLQAVRLGSHEEEGVVCGVCTIGGHLTCLFVMDPFFMMGSMGSAVGEKITLLFEYAKEYHLPVVGYTVSGGARMQEGIISLMQMAKTSGAVKRHSDAGGLYIAVLTDPTTGGVTASFAMEADIILGEPGALIGFAGPRVIEQTIRQKLPKGFQRAEFLQEKGFLDLVAPRKEQKELLARLLALHSTTKEGEK